MHTNALRRAAGVFWDVLPGLALFELCYKAAAAFLLKPAFSWLADHTFGSKGIELAFNERILAAAATPAGLAGVLLLLVLSTAAVYYEFSVLYLMACCAAKGIPCGLRMPVELAVPAFRSLKSPSVLMFAAYALGLLPLADMGISPSLLPRLHIPNFITGELSKTPAGGVLVVLFYLLAFFLSAALLFVLPQMVLGGRVFGCAARSSLRMWKKSWRNALLPAALFCAAWCFLFRWPGAVPVTFIGITGAGLPELAVNLFSGRLLGALPAFFLSGALRILFTVFGISLFTVLYLDMGGRASLPLEALPSISARVDKAQRTAGRVWRRVQQSVLALWRKICGLPFIRRHKRLSAAVSAVLLFLFAGAVFALPAAPHVPIAIGHRGSASGVENTLEAIQGAIDAGADYAEIDVLLSKDGVPMVIHDTSLARLAGDSRNVYELTAAELQALTLEQNGCRGRISTLEEVLEYCKGKIGLLIELKTHGHETKDVARQAAQAVEAQQAADRCLFMSIDYSLVQAMNAIHPEYIIGYCVYGSVSSVDAAALLASGINFLTIEENMVSPRFVNRCLRAGLPVYVWTVDEYESMERYLAEGVCGLISDRPALAADAVSAYEGDNPKDFFRWQNEWLWGTDTAPVFPDESGDTVFSYPEQS